MQSEPGGNDRRRGNCGVSLAPLLIRGQPTAPLDLLAMSLGGSALDALPSTETALADTPPAVNCGLLVGHITLRHGVMDRFDRPATSDETQRMADRVEEALTEGAIGFSTGLDYPPSVRRRLIEVLTLVRRVKPLGGLFCCHHRNYFDGLEDALEEVFELGGSSEVPVVISHHQCTGRGNFGKGPRTLEMIDAARQKTPLGLDCYPITPRPKHWIPDARSPASASWSPGRRNTLISLAACLTTSRLSGASPTER